VSGPRGTDDEADMSQPSLSADEIAAYREQGVVVPGWRLPPDRLACLREALDRVIADNPGVRPEQLISAHIARDSAERVKGSDELLRFACDPGTVGLVTPLIGPDVILWGCQIFCKPGGDGMAVPWHQDGHYWPIRPLATCTVWLALDASTSENGCLRVIPGSHLGKKLYDHMREEREDLVLNQSVKTSTGVLVGMPASRDISQRLCAVCRGQLNVQWSRQTADFQHMEANNGAVLVHLFHDLIVRGLTEVTFLLLKEDLEEVSFTVIPYSYMLFVGHKTVPFLMESVRYAVRTNASLSLTTTTTHRYLDPTRVWGCQT